MKLEAEEETASLENSNEMQHFLLMEHAPHPCGG